ncbi:hypothetical protein K439DRAFT_1656676 [Ramaria rubella]|nr:hypothetical protein K439DRAFT_1656676 [Ramaria rubella]
MIPSKINLTQPFSAVQPVLVSSLGHCLLQGIIFCQMVSFYQRQAADSLRLKLFVYTLFILCLAQTVLEIYKVWTVTVPEEDWSTNQARFIELPLNSVICSSVQAFLVRRVWKLTGRKRMVLIPLLFLLLSTFAAGLIMSVMLNRFMHTPLVNVLNCHGARCIPEFSAWLWGSTILDAVITVTLSVYLLKSKTGFHQLDVVLVRIWNLTLVTAAFPMASMLAAISLFYATGGAEYHTVIALTVISSKLYFNGLLRHLNVRDKLKASMQAGALGRHSIVTIGSPLFLNNPRKSLTISDVTLSIEQSTLHNNASGPSDREYECDRPLTEPLARSREGRPEFDLERGNYMMKSWSKPDSADYITRTPYRNLSSSPRLPSQVNGMNRGITL